MANRLKKGKSAISKSKPRKWSADVMKNSDALDLEQGVFTKESPRQIVASPKRSALHSRRRKDMPYQSAMSMLNFHINRGGKKFDVASWATSTSMGLTERCTCAAPFTIFSPATSPSKSHARIASP